MPKRKKQQSKRKNTPVTPFNPETKLEMLGNRELIIDGCKGIVDYGENYIKLNTGTVMTGVCGDGLLIKSFDNEIAVISGEITEISFVS